MPINMARQIITDNLPVFCTTVNRDTSNLRARINLQWYMLRTGAYEYRQSHDEQFLHLQPPAV